MVMGFGLSFAGFVMTLILLGIKLRLHTQHQNQNALKSRTEP